MKSSFTCIFQQTGHHSPQIHAVYHEDMTAIDVQTGDAPDGYLSSKALAMTQEWVISTGATKRAYGQSKTFAAVKKIILSLHPGKIVRNDD